MEHQALVRTGFKVGLVPNVDFGKGERSVSRIHRNQVEQDVTMEDQERR